jgi:hypothetical protein
VNGEECNGEHIEVKATAGGGEDFDNRLVRPGMWYL